MLRPLYTRDGSGNRPKPTPSHSTVRLSRATSKFRFSGTLWSFATNKNCIRHWTLSLASSIQLTSLQPQTFRHLVSTTFQMLPNILFPKVHQQNLIHISCFPAYLVTFKPTTIKNHNTVVRLLIVGEILKIDAPHYVIVSILPPLTFP
jgi:hypothetical protein